LKRLVGFVAALCLVLARKTAHADPASASSSGGLTPSYLYDGGAIPLLWLPALGSLAVDRWVQPRAQPFYFNALDGGAPRSTWENPPWTLPLAALGLATVMVAGGDDSRWYHVKGLAEAMATSSLLVSILKPAVGRHRPDWIADVTARSDDKSFPSGHTTSAFVIATYGALYLHSRVFDGNTSPWAAAAAYSGIFLGASLVGGERIYHARHHLSDVVAGAAIGSATSYAMFRFQDHRFRNRGSETPEGGSGGWQLTPSFSRESATLGLSGAF
jgi:membrane-associated phospholipid phosphatase